MDEQKRLETIQELERQIAGLPIGYISKKNINGKTRYYHQWSENGKKHSSLHVKHLWKWNSGEILSFSEKFLHCERQKPLFSAYRNQGGNE